MKIPYCDNLSGNLTVTVNLKYEADVFLVDSANYFKYKNGDTFVYYGGHFTRSPAIITVSGPSRWYLIVDDGGNGSQYTYRWDK